MPSNHPISAAASDHYGDATSIISAVVPEPIIQPLFNINRTSGEMRKFSYDVSKIENCCWEHNKFIRFCFSAPPTYEETMGAIDINDIEDDQHPMGSQPFSPRYPVYHE